MNVYQRFMYVGVGGTGLSIGVELERMLRRQLCGADGRRLKARGGRFEGYLPNQLPPFFQSLYVDFDQTALARQRTRLDGEEAVVQETATFATSLTPSARSFAEAAQYLRSAHPEHTAWLPPSEGEPAVAPLQAGAGQYPTVGRAALFHVLGTSGPNALFSQIDQPLTRLARSMPDLDAAAGRVAIQDVTIYVGFSIAGGTGTGLFLDLMHLLWHRAQSILNKVTVRIVPLVVLPSAFEMRLTQQKLDIAKLSATKALTDLQQFVDYQNTAAADSRGDFEITYPGIQGPVSIPPSTSPVAFLFGSAHTLDFDELLASVATTVVAQVSATSVDDPHTPDATNSRSWLADLVNQDPQLGRRDRSGLGNRPFASTISASLTIPTDRIAIGITRKLMADAFGSMTEDDGRTVAAPADRVLEAARAADLRKLLEAPVVPTEPTGGVERMRGRERVLAALARFKANWETILRDMPDRIRPEVAGLAELDWVGAFLTELGRPDGNPVAAARVLTGWSSASDENLQSGLGGFLRGYTDSVAAIPNLPNTEIAAGLFGRLSGTDPKVGRRVRDITEAGRRKSRRLWAEAWLEQRGTWQNRLREMDRDLGALLADLKRLSERAAIDSQRAMLSTLDSGVSIKSVLPFEGELDRLYRTVLEELVRSGSGTSSDAISALSYLLGAADYDWRQFGEVWRTNNFETETAWTALEEVVRRQVESFLIDSRSDRGPALLPDLADQLEASARNQASREGSVAKIKATIGSMLPNGVVPTGPGQPEILVTYPAPHRDPAVEEFIRAELESEPALRSLLNRDGTRINFQNAPQGDAVVANVSLVGQGLLEVEESASLIRFWLDTLPKARPEDKLAWRQRLGYRDLGRISGDRSRVMVLQRLLAAMFDGRAWESEDQARPGIVQLRVDRGAPGATEMVLELEPLFDADPYGCVLPAYERFVAGMSELEADVVDWVMSYTPEVMQTGNTKGVMAGKLFVQLIESIPVQVERLRSLLEGPGLAAGGRRKVELYLEFWQHLLPRALDESFGFVGSEFDGLAIGSLRALYAAVTGGSSA